MSDLIGVMASGRVLQVGPPADVYERPLTPFVARFLGAANLLDGRSVGSASPVVMVRPEHCQLNPVGACRWTWPGKVTSVTFLGADLLAEVACENGSLLRVRARATVGARPGGDVVVGASEEHLWPVPNADPPEVTGAGVARRSTFPTE